MSNRAQNPGLLRPEAQTLNLCVIVPETLNPKSMNRQGPSPTEELRGCPRMASKKKWIVSCPRDPLFGGRFRGVSALDFRALGFVV